ncbi:MAG: Asp-tRNA(Asn)/Glu-tRNA(Gln) amidotransferase subunit GatB [Alphaproteobacteria bacterium]|nr:MAG: Asp-tRNA(Asn)/Glu-tRNA(Gln) amidotransferase subunit GatB [Alphaproteobacteria bacterium]
MSLVNGKWEIVIGLEVHAQIASKTKLFSFGDASFGGEPNAHVDLLDVGMPGVLPVLNEKCVDQAIKSGLSINATIHKKSVFDRKNYFYPDLPLGYQISQFFEPIVTDGHLMIDGKKIRINRIHIEQDAGKSIHDIDPHSTYIDFNRAGVGLMEIVTEPDMSSAEEAVAFVKKLRTLLKYIGTCDGNMEEGSMRADVNISLRKPGGELGTRCEIKNLNSMTFIKKAIEYEVTRQAEILDEGGVIEQETRLFNTKTLETSLMRSKEDAADYRYFPDPDLLPLILTDERIERLRAELPELPDTKKQRYISDFDIKEADAILLSEDRDAAEYFEEGLKSGVPAQLLANWIIVELFSMLNEENMEVADSKVAATDLAAMVGLIADGTISGKIAKDVFKLMWETGEKPADIIEKNNWKQISDSAEIEAVVSKIIAANADKVEQYKSGKTKLFGFFVGMVLKEFSGKANPEVVNEVLEKHL